MKHPNLNRLKSKADAALIAFLNRWPADEGDGLYAPVHYLMQLGGKRLRAVLALSAAEAEGRPLDVAMPGAMGVELFHNFTLMHDDIMDEAPKRRGQDTVHTKWDDSTAILSGDAMYTLAHIAFLELDVQVLPRALAAVQSDGTGGLLRSAIGHGVRRAAGCFGRRIFGDDSIEDLGIGCSFVGSRRHCRWSVA